MSVNNIDTILKESDKVFGSVNPPSIEILHVRTFITFKIPFTNFGFTYNRYGHSAIRYAYKDSVVSSNDNGTVMNIQGKVAGKNIVTQFFTPEEYLFTDKSPQGGIQNREIIGVRLYNIDPEYIKNLHKYYQTIEGTGKFHMFASPIYNKLKVFFPNITERGNCARWTSYGLKKVGLIDFHTIFPKTLIIHFFENKTDNTKIVYYNQHPSSTMKYGKRGKVWEQVGLLQPIRNFMYRDFKKFSDIEITVDEYNNAKIHKLDPLPPSKFRNIINSNLMILPVGIVFGSLIFYKIPRRILNLFTKNNVQSNKGQTKN